MNKIKKSFTALSNFSRIQKQFILLIFDILILNIALFLSFILRLEDFYPIEFMYKDWWLFIILPIISIPFFIRLGLYRSVLKHIGNRTILAIIQSITASVIILGFFMMMTREESFPRSIFLIYWFVSIIMISGVRFLAHWIIYSLPDNSKTKISTAIYGAGEAGIKLSESILNSNIYTLKAIFDDDDRKIGTIINSKKVFNPSKIEEIIKKDNLKIILVAIPSLGKTHRRQLLLKLSKFPVKVMELPSIENIIDGRVTIEDVKNVKVEDILGREPIKPIDGLDKDVKGKNILITGAGGSIGAELSRQVLHLAPNTLILYEQSEFNLYSIHQELEKNSGNVKIIPVLASIHNKFKLNKIFKEYGINTVYHAAAYKHVPMVETNPCDGVWNNIIGTHILSTTALKYNVETFILISTDKAVRPTNVMGATKRFCELILQGLNFENKQKTKFSMVRFGNVLDSAGSVLPLFRKQIKQGGPITVTHSEVIRYFMSIPEAVQLVIQSGSMSSGGDVFLLDMGEPVNILSMAKKMIYLSGLTPIDDDNKNGDIEIEITGLRPGEKLYEELLIGDSSNKTEHPRIMQANEQKLDWDIISNAIEEFHNACKNQDNNRIKNLLAKYIEDYNSVSNNN